MSSYRTNDESYEKKRKSSACYNCGETGHIARQCSQPNRKRNRRERSVSPSSGLDDRKRHRQEKTFSRKRSKSKSPTRKRNYEKSYRNESGKHREFRRSRSRSYDLDSQYSSSTTSSVNSDTPKYRDTSRYDDTPRYSDSSRHRDTPRYSDAPRYSDTPRYSETPRYSDSPRYSDTPRYDKDHRRNNQSRKCHADPRRRAQGLYNQYFPSEGSHEGSYTKQYSNQYNATYSNAIDNQQNVTSNNHDDMLPANPGIIQSTYDTGESWDEPSTANLAYTGQGASYKSIQEPKISPNKAQGSNVEEESWD